MSNETTFKYTWNTALNGRINVQTFYEAGVASVDDPDTGMSNEKRELYALLKRKIIPYLDHESVLEGSDEMRDLLENGVKIRPYTYTPTLIPDVNHLLFDILSNAC